MSFLTYFCNFVAIIIRNTFGFYSNYNLEDAGTNLDFITRMLKP